MCPIVPSAKIGKLLREKAVAAGDHVLLVRACKYGNNKHKKKISTAVSVASSSPNERDMLTTHAFAGHIRRARAVPRVAGASAQDHDRPVGGVLVLVQEERRGQANA